MRDDWIRINVGEIAELFRGITYKKDQAKKASSEGYKPVLRANNIKDVLNFEDLVYIPENLIKKEQLIQNRDIIFAMSSGSKHLVGKSAQAKKSYDGSYGAFCALLRPNDIISKEYVSYFFHSNSFRKLISEIAKGTNINNLKREHIVGFIIPIAPLPEQRAIVSKIEELFSELDNGIANLKAAKDKLEIYRQAVLKKAFEGELTKEWREQQTDFPIAEELLEKIKAERKAHYEKQLEEWEHKVKEWDANGNVGKKPVKPRKLKQLPLLTQKEIDSLPTPPSTWQWTRIDRIQAHNQYSIKAGPFGSSLKKLCYVQNGYKIYGQEQVISGTSTIGNYYVNQEKYNELISCAIQPYDVLISLVGTVGKVLILPEDVEPGIINPRLIKISLNTKYYSPKFFRYYFESSFLKSLYATKSHGATMNILNLGIIQDLPYPLLTLPEQEQVIQEIETRLSVCDNILTSIDDGLLKAEALRQSILKKAFEGTLLTKDELEACRLEPDWEPAEELLKRIKNEKKANA